MNKEKNVMKYINVDGNYNKILNGNETVNNINYYFMFNNKEEKTAMNSYPVIPQVALNNNDYSQTYKNYIKKFEELDGYLFNNLFRNSENWNKEYKFSGVKLKFAKDLIDWVIGKKRFPIESLETFQKEIAVECEIDEKDILKQRWKAMNDYLNGNVENTIKIYNNILKQIIENPSIEQYFKDDILIDGRNIFSRHKSIYEENEFQMEIDKNKHKLANPVYDRMQSDIFNIVHKNIFNYKNRGKYTIMYGIGLENICNQIQNLLYITIFYGSITYLILCRDVLADVMYLYAEALDDDELYEITLRMYALSNKTAEFEKLSNRLKNKSNFWYKEEFINSLISQKKSVIEYYRYDYDCLIYRVYGRFLKDEDYLIFEKEMLNMLETEEITNLITVLKSLRNNVWRINDYKKMFDNFLMYINKDYSALYREISYILNSIDIKDLNEEEYEKFKEIIDNLLHKANKHNVDIVNAVVNCKIKDKNNKYDKIIFQNKHNKILYNIRTNQKKYETVKDILEIIRKRVNEREYSSSFSMYANDYMLGRDTFMEINYTEEMEKLILTQYIPIAKTVLTSEKQSRYEKIKHIKILAYLLLENNNDKYKGIISSIICNMNHKSKEIDEFREKGEDEVYAYQYMIKFILGQINQNELIEIFNILVLKDDNNILSVLECFNIIRKCINTNNVSERIYSIFIYCYNKKFDIDIKCESYSLAKILLKTEKKEEIINLMKSQAQICTLEEGREIATILKYEKIEAKEELKKMLLMNNNFYVKVIAEKNL